MKIATSCLIAIFALLSLAHSASSQGKRSEARAAILIGTQEKAGAELTLVGTVTWLAPAPGQRAQAAVSVPAGKFRALIEFKRNTDSSLPASYFIEMWFWADGDNRLSIAQVATPQVRPETKPAGTSLPGVVNRISGSHYTLGIAEGDAQAAASSLRSNIWLDIPLLFANGRIGKLTFEKGWGGARALQSVFASATRLAGGPRSNGAPEIPSRTSYYEARETLKALGWAPAITSNDPSRCSPGFENRCEAFPEATGCSGSGVSRCYFLWRRGEAIVEVRTSGEVDPPLVDRVRCRTRCK